MIIVKKRVCTCRKSNCLQKYCECIKSGFYCSSHCKCTGCKNTRNNEEDR